MAALTPCTSLPQHTKLSLPVVGHHGPIKPSRTSHWRAGVLIAVHVLMIIHIAHWQITGSTLAPLEPSEAMEFSKHSVINAGFIFFVSAIFVTAIFGRFVCGWACHLVALQDLSRWILRKFKIQPKPLRSRALMFVPLLAFTWMFIWPVAYRLWYGDSFAVRGTVFTTSSLWANLPGWAVAILTLFVCGCTIIYFLGAKGFCTYACPYGAIFGLADRLSPGSIRVTDACDGCGHCTGSCSSNVRVHEEVRDYKMVINPGCMKCLDCISVCPTNALYFGFGQPSILAREPASHQAKPRRDYTIREELLLATFFLLAFFTLRGLYGIVPFLLSLGLSAILSFLVVQLIRLAYRPNLSIHRWVLKRGGCLQNTGYVFAICMIVVLSFCAHSGLIQYHTQVGHHRFEQIAELKSRWFDRSEKQLDPKSAQWIDSGLQHARFVHDWALVGTRQAEHELAWFALLQGQNDQFEIHLNHALNHVPSDAEILVDLGNYCALQNRHDEAISHYRQAISAQPKYIPPYTHLGRAYARIGNLVEAGRVFESGLAVNSKYAPLYYNLGLINAMQGQAEYAITRFQQAIKLKPDFIEAIENLAGLLCAMGRFREGIDQFQLALRLSPNDAGTHFLLGRAYLAVRELDLAEEQFKSALDTAPDMTGAHVMLSRIRAMKANTQNTNNPAGKAAKSTPSPDENQSSPGN